MTARAQQVSAVIPSTQAIWSLRSHRTPVDGLLPATLLFFFLATFAFASADWYLRRRRLGGIVSPSWDCPHCGVTNEAERNLCWSCDAAVSMNRFFPEMGPSADAWR